MSSLINMVGLTVGMTSCLLITIFIVHEVTYDRFEKNGDRIARVIMRYQFAGGGPWNEGNFTSVKVAPRFRQVFPEVVDAVKMTSLDQVVACKDQEYDEKHFLYADSSFFDLFSFHMLSGDPRHALEAPYDVVLTRSAARKYFGTENAVGQVLRVGINGQPYTVTGVVEDCPSNSQIRFDLLGSFSSLGIPYEDSYFDANYTTYLLLRDPASLSALQAKLDPFMTDEMKGAGATVRFKLEPFLSVHLHSPYAAFTPNLPVTYLYVLAAVALLILVIACSTFINLSTARSLERAREVGVRKVLGAGRRRLFRQFIGESALLCGGALFLSGMAVLLLLPPFRQLTGEEVYVGQLFSWPVMAVALLIWLSVTLLAGAYPALVLSGFRPVRVLKGSFKNTGSGQWLRQSLIVFQFVISVFLIAATWVVRDQLYYIQHKDLGFDRSHLVVLRLDKNLDGKIDLVKSELKADPDVLSVSACRSTPVDIRGGYDMRSSVMPGNQELAVIADPIDEDFVRTAGLRLIAGSDLSRQDILDAGKWPDSNVVFHFILNESAAKELGWTAQTAIGKRMYLDASRPGYVKGVVRDFHFASMHTPIAPLVLFPEVRGSELLVKVSGRRLPETLSFLQAKWRELAPYRPFEYHFLDEDFDTLYRAETRLGALMNVFAAVAIVLACLGLFGLSSYAAQQRVKEIGIRKVLGASVTQIVVLLSKNFVRLSVLAILIALPLATWVMSRWLGDFAYRVRLDWTIFAGAGVLTVLLTLLTVSFKAVRAARANPVNNLRTE